MLQVKQMLYNLTCFVFPDLFVNGHFVDAWVSEY